MFSLITFALLLAASSAPTSGEVRLPLSDYLALVEKIESVETARAIDRSRAEPDVAELLSQRLTLRLADQIADINAVYEVEIQGRLKNPVSLPWIGMAHTVTVQPEGSAAVRKGRKGLDLIALKPGRYRVHVAGSASLTRKAGIERLTLAPMTAPVAEVEVSMPAGRQWRCAGAVIAEDHVVNDRRIIRFAPPRGSATAFETRRDTRSAEISETLAATVVVTILEIGREGTRRHDIVLHEVHRGEISVMAAQLPAGLEPDFIITDEGEATYWVEGNELRVERSKKLTSTGYLAVVSRPEEGESIRLDPIIPDRDVRARYLALTTNVAAAVEPGPEESWIRVDITDLPAPVREAAKGLGLVSAWRLRGADAPGRVRVTTMPAPEMIEGVVRARSTLSLLTVEGTLLHRDIFTLEGHGSSFEIGLPPNGTLWSVQVDDVPVRPIERPGRVAIPLGYSSTAAVNVEVVVVQQLVVPKGRSTLNLAPPEVLTPVLGHDWRILLPERNQYRLIKGDLTRIRDEDIREIGRFERKARNALTRGWGGNSEINGRVFDMAGAVIPDAEVQLSENRSGRSLAMRTDETGSFGFISLPAGTYTLQCSRPGFRVERFPGVRLRFGQSRSFAITLSVGTIEETIIIAEPRPLEDVIKEKRGAQEAAREEERAREYRDQVAQLKQGLIGGVKPVPVTIPETGKVLDLAGALPPSRVTVEIEVKAPK